MKRMLVALLAASWGCTGEIGEGTPPISVCNPDDPGCVTEVPVCDDVNAETNLALRPIRRLSETEYHNTVRDLFVGVEYEETQLVPALTDGGFENFVANTRQVGERDVEAFQSTIDTMARRASTNDAFLSHHGCDDVANQNACIDGFVDRFGMRAYRRPLENTEREAFVGLVTEVAAEVDLAGGIETMIAAVLMSPDFLYRVERRGAERATPYEMASRLSYLLWQSMPDDALFAAAEADELRRESELESQARRMLEDDRATEALVDFHRQWFRFARMDEAKYAAKSPTLFPEWTPELRGAVQEEIRRFVRHVAEDDTTLARLYTDRTAFVNAELASLYGLPAVDDWTEVELPASERSGILTRANFLAGTGIAGHGSPVHRGIFVYEQLLCQHLGGVPDDADTSVPAETPEDVSTRELYEQITSPGECRRCHAIVNPIGFTFENFTSTGEYRTEEHGRPVDATGQLSGSDRSMPVDDAVGLSSELAQSAVANACAATRWTTYMLGRRMDELSTDDVCFSERVRGAFAESGGDMRELLVFFITQPEFLGGAQ